FRTDDRRDTKEEVRSRFNSFCDKWSKYYSYFKRQKKNLRIDLYFTYNSYHFAPLTFIPKKKIINKYV
ncbi:MAG TPA: hypothetical protein VK027_03025, partial [Chitinophagaceae bacterium]|nr:hypothetical protein [Chitinophagaceae bacterium]